MSKFRYKLQDLFNPPFWLILLLVAISVAGLTYVSVNKKYEHIVAYIIYVMAVYTIVCVVVELVNTIPKRYRKAKEKVYNTALGGMYITNMNFRTTVQLYGSLSVNLLYVAINLFSGVIFHSSWFITIAAYYAIIAVMRFLLLRFSRKTGIGVDYFMELKRSRLCGIILLFVNIVLSVVVQFIIYFNKGYQYHGIMIYVMAAYTFWVTVMAVRNLALFRKYGSPIMTMAKIISLTAAMVSILSLETAMFSEFGADITQQTKHLFILLTGLVISIIIVAMAIATIVNNTKEIRQIRGDVNEQ